MVKILKPQLSVIVPVYNVEKYLNRCVDSILNQTFTDFELILVDDGSPDNCGKICDEYAIKDSRVHVVHKENGGLSTARNAGLNVARGEYISFIDSDDMIEQGMFEELINELKRTNAQIICCGLYDVTETKKTLSICPQNNEVISSTEAIRRTLLTQGCAVTVCNKIYTANIWGGLRFPEGVNCEDIYVIFEVLNSVSLIALYNKPFYNYCHHENSITTQTFNKKSFDNIIATNNATKYISENSPENLFYAKSLLYESICSVGKRYLNESESKRKECYGLFNNYIIKNLQVEYDWFQKVCKDTKIEGFQDCVYQYLNMYAVLLVKRKGWIYKKDFNLVRKSYKSELHKWKKLVGVNFLNNPFLFFPLHPIVASLYNFFKFFKRVKKKS